MTVYKHGLQGKMPMQKHSKFPQGPSKYPLYNATSNYFVDQSVMLATQSISRK